MASASSVSPSVVVGCRLARQMWSLIAVVWLLPLLIVLPLELLFDLSAGTALARLPVGELPPGEAALVVLEELRPLVLPLALFGGGSLLVLWQWSIIWRAGVVAWQLWAGGGAFRLVQVIGLGLAWWWRYLRLSLVALSSGAVALTLVWWPLYSAIAAARGELAELRVLVLLGVAVGLSIVLWLLCLAAGLRAAWLLGLPHRRSAVVAFGGGLWGALRSPLSTFVALLLWSVPLLVLLLLPLFLGAAVDGLARSPWNLPILGACGLGAAFCRVALLASFAPVSGLLPGRPGDESPT